MQQHAGDAVCVTMRAVQCANLASALAAFVTEVSAQLAAAHPDAALAELAAEFDANDLALLDAARD